MTQLSILGPPRGGRRVKSEQEALAEAKSWSKPGNLAPVTPPDVAPSPVEVPGQGVSPVHSIVHPYFKVLGRFNVGGITKQGETYIFHDLELPMGCWRELTLPGKLILGDPQSFDEWSRYTESSQPIGVMPADIRYGLMAVCYLNKGKPSTKGIIRAIRYGVWLPDSNMDCPYTSTKVLYRANAPALISPGVGWSNDHPFGVKYGANIAGSNLQISRSVASEDSSLQAALEGLLGENDAGRCKSVLEWSMGARPARLWRLIKENSGDGVILFGVYTSTAGIDTCNPCIDRKPARAILADKQNYIPK